MSSDVRLQDTVFVISSVASSKIGRDLAWTFFKVLFFVIKLKKNLFLFIVVASFQ